MKYEERIVVPKFVAENGFSTTPERSYNMSRIKAKDTKPELALRKALFARGLRYRVHPKHIPGKPDIYSKKYKLAIFVDGEFWHGKDWINRKKSLKKNRDFWIAKIERNMQRDREINAILADKGLKVMRFWDSEIKKELPRTLDKIFDYINKTKLK
jgi:DNA mismatch endonuclease (patch repair protein)